jgi:hypothetical protein
MQKTTLASATAAKGSFRWHIKTTTPAGTDYLIVLISPSNRAVSGEFTVTESPTATTPAAPPTTTDARITSSSPTIKSQSTGTDSSEATAAPSSTPTKDIFTQPAEIATIIATVLTFLSVTGILYCCRKRILNRRRRDIDDAEPL